MNKLYKEYEEKIEKAYNMVGLIADDYKANHPEDQNPLYDLADSLSSLLKFADALKKIPDVGGLVS